MYIRESRIGWTNANECSLISQDVYDPNVPYLSQDMKTNGLMAEPRLYVITRTCRVAFPT